MLQQTIKNRTIFCRDNLEILRGIDTKTIDLIYLDPPFNKNKDFIAPIGGAAAGAGFKDIFGTEDVKDEWVGLIADEYPTLHNYLTGIRDAGHKSNKYYLCYMAIRLMECRRVLKDTGSLYYHCDQDMSHYIKIMMDCVFGHDNFQNEIVWCYRKWTNAAAFFQSNHDIVLCYNKHKSTHYFDKIYDENSPQSKKYERGYDTNVVEGGVKQLIVYDMDKAKHKIEAGEYDKIVDRTDKIASAISDWWEIPIINSQANERLGYPTQKPVALLDRIIKASCPKDGVVLDPFCGCATTCVAAERLGRQWIGIDISKKAFDLVRLRLGREIEGHDTLFYENKIDFRTDIPQRTDIDHQPDKLHNKHHLFGLQEGKCNGCATQFAFRHFHIDHIYPKSKGGGDNIENLQLLCGSCNAIKGNRDMAFLKARLKEMKFI